MNLVPLSRLHPIVTKLTQHTQLSQPDADALKSLPHHVISYEPGAYVVREGDRANSCAVLLSGFAYRSKATVDGSRQILAVHVRGDLIDFQNSLLSQADHSLQALTHIEVASISCNDVIALAEARPGVARALWRDTLIDASIFREWILNVGRRDARQRVAHLLCEMALRQEAAGLCTGPTYAWPMTQDQLGDATGMTTVHVNRTLHALESGGVLSKKRGSVTIADWSNLQTIAGFNRDYLHLSPSDT